MPRTLKQSSGNCYDCGKPEVVLVKITETERGFGELKTSPTKNFIKVCSNVECYRYSKIEEMPSWQRYTGQVPREDGDN